MVSLRGVSNRGNSQVRKLSKKLNSNKLGRDLYAKVRQGDSITSIQRDLRLGGVRASRLTIERTLFNRYNASTLANYYDRTKLRYGSRSGFDVGTVQRLSGTSQIKVMVRGITKNGEVYNFDTYVNVGDSTSLNDVLDNLREIYEEDNETNKSPLKEIMFR